MADDVRKTTLIDTSARCPGMSYTDMLDADTREVPDFLREESGDDFGTASLSTDRYTSADFAALESEKLWPKVWQFAAREEEMPDPGDTVVYENAGRSYVLVRQKNGDIRAFYNVCLHRGRKLKTKSGHTRELKCLYHGFTWNNDGSLKEIPCDWDFAHLKDKDMALPEARIDRWQGFIMLSEDKDIAPFREWIGPAVSHYDRWRLDECYTAAWIGKVIPANWKATAEAFMEAWHSITTHPQILPFTGDANTRYDTYGDHMNRAITPSGVLSPHIASDHDQAYVLEKIAAFVGQNAGTASNRTKGRAEAVDGKAASADKEDPLMARKILADANREAFGAMSGHDFSQMSDSEMLDNYTYNIFPNFAPWGGFMPNIVYRWRPWGDQDHCLMEVRILVRNRDGEKMPNAVPMHLIPDDQPFSTAADLIGASLASVFDQDMANLPYVQEGMKASANKTIELGAYQEVRIRHFHRTLDKYLNA